MDKPHFLHDCDNCIYLGWFGGYDLYFHPSPNNPVLVTVIARFGNEGADYMSGLNSNVPILQVAENMAKDQSLI